MRAHLHQLLGVLTQKAVLELRSTRAAAATHVHGPRALHLLWILPLFGIGLVLATPLRLSPIVMLALMCVAPLGLLAARFAEAWLRPCAPDRALAIADQQLRLKGRATHTDELLIKGELNSFEVASLEDATGVLEQAARQHWQLARPTWQPGEDSAPHFVAAALLLGVYLLLASAGQTLDPSGASLPTNVAIRGHTPGPSTDQQPGTLPALLDERQELAPKPAKPKPRTQKSVPKQGEEAKLLPDDMQSSEGKTGEGKSSDAQSQSSASESRGAPSGQSPAPPKEGSKPSKPKKKPKKKKPGDDKRQEPKEENDPGGSTAGRGSAKGSNRNTTTSKWSSKDQVTTPDEQEIEDDEDTDDEEEEQENRGGMQPNLRDRRPPASRDLRIGFGNRPSPDANGRGGPSESKKSRGTASLVLGVPIPDRIKGQPNAGPTRITQERIEPSAENEPKSEAQARAERAAAIGQLKRAQTPDHPRQLSPWQRNLIRAYIDSRQSPNSK